MVCRMKVVRARIPDSLHSMLQRESRRTKRSMAEIVVDALQSRLFLHSLRSDDPFLTGFPIGRSRGRGKRDIGARHDEILYGAPE